MSTTTETPNEVQPIIAEPNAPVTRGYALDKVECRNREDGRLIFRGHAAVFDGLSEDLGGFREQIKRGAFRKVLDDSADVRLLWNHDPNLLLARTTSGTMELSEDPKGLSVYAEMAPTSYARDLHVLLERRDITQMSFGFKVDQDSWANDDGQIVRTIHSLSDLIDVSAVVFPAYPQTDAATRGRVCGIQVLSSAGEVDIAAIKDLMMSIGCGKRCATAQERQAIDQILLRTDLVSPWMLEKAAGACSLEPGLRACIPGKRITVNIDAQPSGEHYRLAARRRRLSLLAS